MKRLFYIVNFLAVFVLGLGGTCYALSATLVKGPVPAALKVRSAAGVQPIVLTFGDAHVVIHDEAQPVPGNLLSDGIALAELFLIGDHRVKQHGKGYEKIYTYRRYHLGLVRDPQLLTADKRIRLRKIAHSETVTSKPKLKAIKPDPKVKKLIGMLDEVEYAKYMGMLADPYSDDALETRYTCHTQAITAANIIKREFKKLGLKTTSPRFANDMSECHGVCKTRNAYNVIGIKEGTSDSDEFYLVGAHFDSVNEVEDEWGDPDLSPGCDKAPGACDNASGVAGVLELARIFSQVKTKKTLVFVAFGAEEIGTLGSEQYVSTLLEDETDGDLKAFVVLDMISYASNKADWGVWMEASKKTAAQKARGNKLVQYAAAYAPKLTYEIGWAPANSDHEPFLREGIPGGLLIQKRSDVEGANVYEQMHTDEDTVAIQNSPFALQILNIAVATLAEAGVTFPQ
ncbi:MAG: M28 family metallopeptidase [Syntrophobacteraceae bacterium]